MKIPKPTRAELEILQALWQRGNSTVREVHDELGQKHGYTTILKMLQIMTDKGLVTRKEAGRAHVYSPTIKQSRATGEFIADLVDKLFGGSRSRLVLEALNGKTPTSAEIREIRKFLDEVEGGKQ